ncbi:Rib/alpha-like domain-containing protein [Gardnerella greenwoodii]|uniref:Peptidase n=1 Tax=Gardnerella greenwoodii TaxID=2914925 RepID=A0A2N6RZP8_9BIFI|nr:Rib/alpha-like domain-containing protein [Gardnerella greenwoodii]MDF0753943.1 lipase family protein [Gardnerella greenwoodii]PMC43503.1 peptidase [Gardnerella greenwoodii]
MKSNASIFKTISGIIVAFGLLSTSFIGLPLATTTAALATENSTTASEPAHTPLTAQTAHDISTGRIRLENNQIDSLLYHKPELDPNADSDGDDLKNSEELYTYVKNGRTYYGYNSHPLIKDTDGDGLDDKADTNPRRWNISPRDMALFMELVYRGDDYVNKVLDNKNELTEIYKDRNEYKLMHNELAPYWKVKKTYHESDGFDAVLFENVNPEYPFIEQNGVQVLGIRGTQGSKDAGMDFKLFFGGEISQAITAEKLMDELNKNHLVSNLYVTGHSLGGYLTERALVYAKRKNYDWFTKAYTFNAPKIKGSPFRPSMKQRAEELNKLTKEGYAEHYATKKDTLISFIGHVDGAKIIDTGNNGHSSRNFLDKKMDNQPGFTVGNRKQIDGTGTVNPGVTKVKETPKPAEIKPYEETYNPEVKEILLANNEPLPNDFKDALANAKDLPQGATFEDVTNRDLIKISKIGDYTGKLKITINNTKTIEKEFTIRVLDTPKVIAKSDANLRFELNSTFPNDFDAKRYLDGVPSNAKVSLLNNPKMNTKGVQDISVEVSFVNGTKRTVKIPVKIYEAKPWAEITPAKEVTPGKTITPIPSVTAVESKKVEVKKDAKIPADFNFKPYLQGLPKNSTVKVVEQPNTTNIGEATFKVEVTFASGAKRKVTLKAHVVEVIPATPLKPAKKTTPWTELTPATPVTPTPVPPAPTPAPPAPAPVPPTPQPQPQPQPQPEHPSNPQHNENNHPAEPENPTNHNKTNQSAGTTTIPSAPASVNKLKTELENTLKAGEHNIVYAGKNNKISVQLNATNEFMQRLMREKTVKAYAYIYSNPRLLNGQDGTEYVTVHFSADGKPSFDAVIPQEYSGNHTIVLIDEQGNQVAWTNVLVKRDDTSQNPSTGETGIPQTQNTQNVQNVQNTSENELTSTASTEATVSANKNVIAQPEASKPTTSSHPLANTGIQTIPALISIAVTLFASFVVVLSVKKANRIKY